MIEKWVNQLFDQLPGLEEQGLRLARAIHGAVLQGGSQVRHVVDLWHGTWLGHPLHPVLTDIVVGAWSLATAFDLASLRSRARWTRQTADALTAIGTAAAVPTTISGLADYSAIPKSAAGIGLTHGLLNGVTLVLYALSLRARGKGQRDQAVGLSVAASSLMLASAYLGGHLVYDRRVGVKHGDRPDGLEAWSAVMAASELPEGTPRRVEVKGNPVLLYRQDGQIYAVGAVCPHAGGPLEEGQFYDGCVQCPWHDSVFKLSNGGIVHGPTAYALPNYALRVREGQIEIRLSP